MDQHTQGCKPGGIWRLLSIFGIGEAVFYSLLSKAWGLGVGLLSLFFIGRCLSPVEQGYYYTFANLVALQVLFELGMIPTITQYVAHEAAYFYTNPDSGVVSGAATSISRAVDFIKRSTTWFKFASIGYVLAIGAIGVFVMGGTDLDRSRWLLPWLLLVIACAMRLLLTVYIGILEGMGYITETLKIRLLANILGGFTLWFAMVKGLGLFSPSIQILTIVSISGALIFKRFNKLYVGMMLHPDLGTARIDWSTEVLPYQWRVSVSWLSGFLIFELFTPVLLRCSGAVSAGKFGMALQIGSAISAIGSAWLATQIPDIAGLTAKRSFDELRDKLKVVLTYTVSATVLASASAIFVIKGLELYFPTFKARLPRYDTLLLIIFTVVLNQFVFVVAAFARARKREPFLLPSVAAAVVTVTLLLALIPKYGVLGASFAYFLPTVLVATPCAAYIAKKLYQ